MATMIALDGDDQLGQRRRLVVSGATRANEIEGDASESESGYFL
jgi:hypothetical protein